MTQEEITEGNRLIAEFMGHKIKHNGTNYYILTADGFGIHPTDMQYHASWDALMPVVDRIEDVCKDKGVLHGYWNTQRDIRIFREPLDITYVESVQFIRYHNIKTKPNVK